jgi:SAM-dependent methyltransferase
MNPEEYKKLERIDREHWFYHGKRVIVQDWINRYLTLAPDDLFVDAGCGTGTLLVQMSGVCRVLGLDSAKESIEIAAPRVEAVGGRVLQTRLDKVDLPDRCAAVVTLLDVLEHLDDDRAAVEEAKRIVRPGGLIVITVPALKFLWSDWDVVLHHRRRYTRRELLALIDCHGLEVLRCAYFNWLALLPILSIRTARKLIPATNGKERAEDRIPPRWLNWLLRETMVRPACWQFLSPPIGVSLLAVMRRRI